MAADLAALKTELRAFERAFESQHGRAPTRDDLTPPQRELYRQYKQLKQQGAAPAAEVDRENDNVQQKEVPPQPPPPAVPPPPQRLPSADGKPLKRLRFGTMGALRTGRLASEPKAGSSSVTATASTATVRPTQQASDGWSAAWATTAAPPKPAVPSSSAWPLSATAQPPSAAPSAACPCCPSVASDTASCGTSFSLPHPEVRRVAPAGAALASRTADPAASRWRSSPGKRRLQQLEAEAAGTAGPEEPAQAEVKCCIELGCICTEPGLRCGFAWRKQSEYEDARARSVRENNEKLRALGLLPPEAPPVVCAEVDDDDEATGGGDAGDADAVPRAARPPAPVAGVSTVAKAGRARASRTGAAASATSATSAAATAASGAAATSSASGKAPAPVPADDAPPASSASSRGRSRKASRPDAPTGAGSTNFVKHSKSGTYAGRGGCRGKVGQATQSGAKRARFERANKMMKRRKGSAVGAPPQEAVTELETGRAATTAIDAAAAAAAAAEVATAACAQPTVEQEALLCDASLLAQHGTFPDAEEPPRSSSTASAAASASSSSSTSAEAANAGGEASTSDGGVGDDAVGSVLLRTLRSVFGMRNFRPGQEQAIRRVLARRSTLLVLPTGGGKSLCYQLPAFVSTQITLVVSPLIALMGDQLASLPAALGGVMVSSSQQPHEQQAALDALRRRDAHGAAATRVMYIAPERLCRNAFQNTLRALPPVAGCRCGAPSAAAAAAAALGGLGAPDARCAECGAAALPPLGFACVDEAHCLSEWSHNFRPTYMAVGSVLRSLGVDTVLGLTATATSRTVASVCGCLQLPPTALIRCDLRRDNLRLRAEVVTAERRMARLVQLLQRALPAGGRGAAIVYTSTRHSAEQVASELQSRGWRADYYHAGRSTADRARVHAAYMRDELRVMVATVAFGMGVHKPDVRLVVHVGLPRSVEGWLQETGRAGRDGLPAACHALVAEADYVRLHSLSHSDGVELDAVGRLLGSLLRNARNGYGEVAHQSLGSELDMSLEGVGTVLALLAELPRGTWREAAAAAAAAAAAEGGAAGAKAAEAEAAAAAAAAARPAHDEAMPLLEVLPDIRRTAVLSFHHEPPEAVAERSPLVAMLLKYAKVQAASAAYQCPLVQAASELGLSAHAAHAELHGLHEAGVLRLDMRDPAFYVRLRAVPEAAEQRAMVALLHRKMQQIVELQCRKLDAVAALLWQLSGAAGFGAADGADGPLPASVAATLERYMDDSTGEEAWEPPVKRGADPERLRGDLVDFVRTQLKPKELGGAGRTKLSGRAVARVFHRLASPAFRWADWKDNRYWGKHADVDFEVVRRMADEVLETVRRAHLASMKAARKRD